MPLTPYLLPEAFDPETIRVLNAAFEDAWQSLAEGGTDLGSPTDATRDTLAQGIVAAASLGERDQWKLRNAALAYLGEARARPL
jgi:hypothetical protein